MNKNNVKKIIGYMVVFAVLFAVSGNVKAIVCNYNDSGQSTSGYTSMYANNYIEVTFGAGDPEAYISLIHGEDVKKKIDVNNWVDIASKVNTTNECPPYLMVTQEDGFLNFDKYNVYLDYDEENLNKIAVNKGFEGNNVVGKDYSVHTITERNFNAADTKTSDEIYEKIVEWTKALLEEPKNFSFDDCIDETKIITRLSDCKDQLDGVGNIVDRVERQLQGFISDGRIDRNDPRVQAYLDAAKQAQEEWAPIKKQLEQEQRKIDEMMGIVEPNGGQTKSSTWTATDGNTNKFLKKIWDMIKIIVPMLVIIFSIVDFLKVLFISDEKNYKAAYHKLLWRIAVGIILFVLPAILKLLLELAGLQDVGIFEIFE